MTKSEFKELEHLALERQRHYMQLTGQLDSNGKMLINVNYIELLREEYNEFLEDGTKNPKFGKVKKKDISPNLQQFFRK